MIVMTNHQHLPFHYHVPNSQMVMLFIHGILESPNQFKQMAHLANELNISTYALLLPGHGHSGETFAKASRYEWMAHVEDTLKTLRKTYQHIIFVGHSMGTLLAIDAYVKNKEQILGMILIASPLYIHCTLRGATCGLKVALNRIDQHDVYAVAMKKSYSVTTDHLLTYFKWVPRYLDLFYLMAFGRNSISQLEIPMLIVHCHQDEFVSKKSLAHFKSVLKNRNVHWLELIESGHFYYESQELMTLHQTYTQFLKDIIKKAD
ncbi:MAG TPA: alpha/beta hydrolase [Firmicutes bacterium]|nr:alpha/beta hydrolase [Bacillota bacterium]